MTELIRMGLCGAIQRTFGECSDLRPDHRPRVHVHREERPEHCPGERPSIALNQFNPFESHPWNLGVPQ